jgi:hypothetical protein
MRYSGRSITAAIALLFVPVSARAADAPPRTVTDEDANVEVGVALAAETVVSPGSVCPSHATAPCIFGSGGGVVARFGYRFRGPWYFGGAYEFTRHDSSNLLRLAILQQLRAEGRYYFERGQRATGFFAAGAGAHIYGSDWAASTGGGLATLGAGVELELSAKSVVGCAAMYRALFPYKFRDGAGERRADGPFGFGLAHMIGLEFTLEVRDPVPHW